MQRWEYAIINYRSSGGSIINIQTATATFFRANSPKVRAEIKKEGGMFGGDSLADAIGRYMAQMGSDGWELVTVLSGSNDFQMMFKRPLSA